MGAMTKFKVLDVMDWSRFNIDGWLEQYGAYCGTVQMKGGNLPEGLHINQIYWLMRKGGEPVSSKIQIRCEISDFEADQIEAMLRSAKRKGDYLAQYALMCLIKHKVEGKSLSRIADETNQSKTQVGVMVGNARFYLFGHDKRLKIE